VVPDSTKSTDPVIPDEEIDRLEFAKPGDSGPDRLTEVVKKLEHYGAKFRPGFFDQPIEDVREGLKEAARSERVLKTYHQVQEAKANQREKARLETFYEVTGSGKYKIRYPLLAEYVAEELFTISFNDTVYVYQDGIYAADKGRVAAFVKEVLEKIEYKDAFSVVRREVTEYLLAEDPQIEYPFNKLDYHIPVKNGVVRIDPKTYEIDLIPHAPEHKFTYRLNVEYDPDAESNSILDMFNQWVEEEDVRYLLQPLSVSFLQVWGQPQKQCYLFEGGRDGGKTSYCEFLYEVIGPGAFSQVDLYSITKDRFALADLENKMMNIRDEMRPVNINSAEAIKNLTGGLKHRIERKHVDGYHVTLPAAHVFTCNKPPEVKDVDDDAFWSRWVYVVFPNQFPRDATFKKRLNTERNKSAYLNLVLKVVTEVMGDPNALKRMSSDEVCERWTEAADATIKFIRTHFDTDASSSIEKDEVYSAYIRYCQEGKIPIRPKPSFSADLNRMGIVGARPRDRGSRLQVYAGIRWKADSPLRGQGGQGELKLITREKEGTIIYTNNFLDHPDHPDQSPIINPSDDDLWENVSSQENTPPSPGVSGDQRVER